MGISISLQVDFQHVSQAKWESVYRESLRLIEAYPFMDKIVDKETFKTTFFYVDRTRERRLAPWYPDTQGWYVIGDMQSFAHAESFMLVQNVDFYTCAASNLAAGDVYFSLINWNDLFHQEIQTIPTQVVQVFDAKTQGYDYHKYVLGIACLIEDRLKPHAVVSGNITRAQIESSTEWVNQYLRTEVMLPDRCRYTDLLARIQKSVKSEAAQVEAFFGLLLYPENCEIGDFVRDRFSEAVITEYWQKQFDWYTPGTLGMNREIKRYLDMCFCPETLCDILMQEDRKNTMDLRSCITAILGTGILEKGQQPDMLSLENQEDLSPSSISALLGKSILAMAGMRDLTNNYIHEEDLKKRFYKKSGQRELVDQVFSEYAKTSHEEGAGHFMRELQKAIASQYEAKIASAAVTEDDTEYVIQSPAHIIRWNPGDSVHPNLQKSIQSIKEFSDGMLDRIYNDISVAGSDASARIHELIKLNTQFYIRKEVWDYVFERIHDNQVFFRFVSLLSINAETMRVCDIVKPICNNLVFLQHYFFDNTI